MAVAGQNTYNARHFTGKSVKIACKNGNAPLSGPTGNLQLLREAVSLVLTDKGFELPTEPCRNAVSSGCDGEEQ
jgi:hypothetical protein